MEETTISNKKVLYQSDPHHLWVAVGDSHLQLLSHWFNGAGAASFAISGGTIWHAEKILESFNFLSTGMQAYFLLIGGNDLDQKHVLPIEVVGRKVGLVRKVLQKRPYAVVVTMTVIPRTSEAEPAKGDWFIRRVEMLDQNMTAAGPGHHHLITDAYISESISTYGPAQPRVELMAADRIHLNLDGRVMLQSILDFAFSSVAENSFKGTREIICRGERRFAFWRF